MSTTSTVKLNIHQPSKPKGWCDEQGIAHSWEMGPTMTVNPPIQTRQCTNCGQRQYFSPGAWTDAP